MGNAECLVVVDLQEDTGSTLRADFDTYWPVGQGERLWFSWEDEPSADATPIGPHVESDEAGGEPEGFFRVCEKNGAPKTQDADFQVVSVVRELSEKSGGYTWNQVGTPMVLLILPAHRSLSYADPKPITDGVWERNQRLCVFWGAPANPASYRISLGGPVGSLAGDVHRWKRRTGNFRPSTRRQVALWFVVSILLIAVIAGLIGVLGQAVAGVWIGTLATVASLVLSVLAYRQTRQPSRGALSNPA